MTSEILDAICGYFHDDEETVVNCLMYLKQITKHEYTIDMIEEQLWNMSRCIHCGEKLQIYEIKETHDELDGHWVETMSEMLCPNCDR